MLGFDVGLTSRKIPNSVNVKDAGGVCVGLQAYTYLNILRHENSLFFFFNRLLGVLFLIFFFQKIVSQTSP